MSGEFLNVKRATHPHWSGTLVLDEFDRARFAQRIRIDRRI